MSLPEPQFTDSDQVAEAETADPVAVAARVSDPGELAGLLSARLCHDFISPASAIASGLDLLEDPSAQDMREDALNLIAGSARKLVALLAFSRVAFGGAAGSESFDTRELETLARGVFAHVRPELTWEVEPAALPKPAARALLNLAQIGAGALPTGGQARMFAKSEIGGLYLGVEATGTRVRMKPEIEAGLRGEPLPEGHMAGHWVQAWLMNSLIKGAGGSIVHQLDETRFLAEVRLPA